MSSAILTQPGPEPDRELRYGADPDHVADVWLPATSGRPLVVLIHGGFWRPRYDRRHTRVMSAALRDAGWPVVALEYRRAPGNPDDTTADLQAALPEISRELPSAGTVLIGHSAGGHLALWTAVTCPPPGLLGTVALAPVANLAAAYDADLGSGAVGDFLGGPAAARPDLDPMLLPGPAGPVVLVHGDQDDNVPLSQSVSYVGAHPDAKLVALANIAHFELIDPASTAWPTVLAELEKVGRS